MSHQAVCVEFLHMSTALKELENTTHSIFYAPIWTVIYISFKHCFRFTEIKVQNICTISINYVHVILILFRLRLNHMFNKTAVSQSVVFVSSISSSVWFVYKYNFYILINVHPRWHDTSLFFCFFHSLSC